MRKEGSRWGGIITERSGWNEQCSLSLSKTTSSVVLSRLSFRRFPVESKYSSSRFLSPLSLAFIDDGSLNELAAAAACSGCFSMSLPLSLSSLISSSSSFVVVAPPRLLGLVGKCDDEVEGEDTAPE